MDQVMTEKDCPKIFKRVWEESTRPDNARNGFRRCGLYPLNHSAIDKTKLYPSSTRPEPASAEPTSNIIIATPSSSGTIDGAAVRLPLGGSRPDGFVSAAFNTLSVPSTPPKTNRAAALRHKLPKAVSGDKALAMLRQQRLQKETEEAAKLERKVERDRKRKEKKKKDTKTERRKRKKKI